MLLIAQPKSASSSLVKTLAKITKGFGHVGIRAEKDPVYLKKYSEINRYHTTLCLRPTNKVKTWATDRKNFFKDHFLPDDPAIADLKHRAVILLRNVDDTVDSYRRFAIKYNKKVDLDKMRKHITAYQRGCLKIAKNNKNFLVVWYWQLVEDFEVTMNKIIKFYKLTIPETLPPLARVYYTGVGEKRIKSKRTKT